MTMFLLMGAIIILIASATFVEKFEGSEAAKWIIYYNPITLLIWMLLIVNTICIGRKRRWWQRKIWGTITLHSAFIVILLGAFITHVFSYEGVLHIREGKMADSITTQHGEVKLPFAVRLNDFVIERYGGSQAPSSYKSDVDIVVGDEVVDRVTIAVNRVYDIGGYRLFQSSYDADEQGSILSVNHDRLGMIITYFGYLLLLVGIFLTLFNQRSHLRQLIRELGSKSTILFLILCGSFSNLTAANTIPSEHSHKVGQLLVQNNSGRIEPIDTYSAKLLRKISKRSSFEGYSAVQVIWGFIFNPNYWSGVKIISQSSERISQEFGLEGDRLSFDEMFDLEGNYKLSDAVVAAASTEESKRGRYERDLLKLDERVNIIYSLLNGSEIKLFPIPEDPAGRWVPIMDDKAEFRGDDSMFVSKIMPWYVESIFSASRSRSGDWSEPDEILSMIDIYQQKRGGSNIPTQSQIDIEILSNRVDPFFIAMIGYLLSGVALFILSILSHEMRLLKIGVVALLGASFLLQTLGICARWYISNQMPWASSYETIVHIGWAAAITAIILSRRSSLAAALASFFGGVVLFVATLNWLDPQITPLVPVLKSSWLMVHVATITSAYGLMGISALIGVVGVTMGSFCVVNFDLKQQLRELRLVSEITLHIALYFMIVGIFVGAVWANEAWGRYWGWDPKETWALITMLIYALALHLRFTPLLKSDLAHFALSVLSFSSVLMTYFGVNFYLTGLHSYATGEMPSSIYAIYIFYAIFILTAIHSHYKFKQ